ncbi:hypothetical protein F5J12DRAFT_412546 [Pisolithus orientalis]|uniref:uncharacterized protein n=1 Tax=Pisolithus orientalis TaxID=936130 RepID=UPI0022259273|nr:uncharacterized protein F5J12DRAFT_412546 [Pisolithus orientalis]KAI5994545.1 hypothetical protein F5J12DRAFT_412546 [Pisolithus orientalis]
MQRRLATPPGQCAQANCILSSILTIDIHSSWASYNLLSACAICTQQSTWASWATYSASCGNYVSSTTYYPWDQGCRLPENEKIPFFAATNPIYWTNGTFNENEAAVNGSSGTPDVTGQPLASSSPSATSTSSSSSSGAIIGGIVGALAVVRFGRFHTLVHRSPASTPSSTSTSLPAIFIFPAAAAPFNGPDGNFPIQSDLNPVFAGVS